jgi:DDE superfamily endonuclease
MISEEVRQLIVSQFLDGRKVSEIFLSVKSKCTKRTVYRVVAEFQKKPPKKVKKRKKQPLRKVTSNMVRRMVRLLTIGKAHHSFRSVARLLGIHESTVRDHMEGREIRCFKKTKRNLIPKVQQEKRQKCCRNFRKSFRKSDISDMLFSDECYICVGKYFNHQNERCYGYSLELIRDEKKFREFPKTALCAMVFGAVSRGGRSPLIVLKSGFSLNQYTYKEECLIPMLQNLPYGMTAKTVIFYQDKAPCHAARTVQSFLEEEMPCFVRNGDIPPNSPDLNVLDYSIWSYLKERLNKHGLISSFDRLKKILQEEWEAIPQQLIQDSIDSWLSRLRKVEKARGGHIE